MSAIVQGWVKRWLSEHKFAKYWDTIVLGKLIFMKLCRLRSNGRLRFFRGRQEHTWHYMLTRAHIGEIIMHRHTIFCSELLQSPGLNLGFGSSSRAMKFRSKGLGNSGFNPRSSNIFIFCLGIII